MIGIHCDREGCDTWQRAESAVLSWLVVSDGELLWHFCTKDHLMLWAANSEPRPWWRYDGLQGRGLTMSTEPLTCESCSEEIYPSGPPQPEVICDACEYQHCRDI